ncbi:polysaccharide export protein [Methylocystis sp. WRRC1]|uniref:polysaccharide biosynthesis/export family protein n=1 Tax=unclassified Methylocystis TaxID=2625913 RepID=UPI0001F888C9|nr:MULTISPECIES: polysaccharide biosynthesis/export family protein [unclassified Methylocystis]MCC3247266.1 polysaccharide export protein [Methylocystis sp. WRRC1]
MANTVASHRAASKTFTLATAMIVIALLSGCAAPGNYQPELFAATAHEPYTLAAGDRLRVIVFGQDSLSNTYSVDGSGRIAMPLIGSVPVQGRDAQAVEREIAARLRNGFIREPRVSVEVEAFRPFFVLGEVTNAGQFPFVDGMTVRTAVAIAGGFSPRGYQGGADITRVIDGYPVTGRVPLDTPVRPGDTITVRERIF